MNKWKVLYELHIKRGWKNVNMNVVGIVNNDKWEDWENISLNLVTEMPFTYPVDYYNKSGARVRRMPYYEMEEETATMPRMLYAKAKRNSKIKVIDKGNEFVERATTQYKVSNISLKKEMSMRIVLDEIEKDQTVMPIVYYNPKNYTNMICRAILFYPKESYSDKSSVMMYYDGVFLGETEIRALHNNKKEGNVLPYQEEKLYHIDKEHKHIPTIQRVDIVGPIIDAIVSIDVVAIYRINCPSQSKRILRIVHPLTRQFDRIEVTKAEIKLEKNTGTEYIIDIIPEDGSAVVDVHESFTEDRQFFYTNNKDYEEIMKDPKWVKAIGVEKLEALNNQYKEDDLF